MIIIALKNKPKDFDSKQTCLAGEEYLKFLNENYEDSICCFNSRNKISTQISKEHHHVFNLKYDIKVDENTKYENDDD